MTKRQIKAAEDRCYRMAAELTGALEKLSSMASEVLGYDVRADLCGGGEIEFRTVDGCGYVDDYCCIRMEEVLNKLGGND